MTGSVAPGGQATFAFAIVAPTTPGSYGFDWRMLREGKFWFGAIAARTITVNAPAPVYDAQLTNAVVPATMTAGSTYNVSLTFKNTGNVTWSQAANYRIGSTSPVDNMTFGRNRVDMSVATVAPGQSATFDFQVQAPSTTGNHLFDWGMLWEGQRRFGQTSARTVTVSAPVPKPVIEVAHIPAPVAGSNFTTYWNASNATSLSRVCTASGTGFKVNESLAVSGNRTQAAQAAWVGYPSNCTWTASGAGGSTTYTETMTTAAPATPKPTISVARNPAPVAGQSFTTSWNTSNATSLSRVCTASGTGYTVNESLAVNSSRTETASAAWVGYPSSCTWTATGAGGSTTYTETMTTAAPATPKPTISVARNPAPVAGQSFTTSWSTSNATSLSRVCTASGTGYTVNESLAVNSSRTETASAAWVGYPSSCTWTATGAGGSTAHTETMTTQPGAIASTVTYIHTDGLGSPVARTNALGQVISRTRYEPYGYVADGAQPTVGFTGHVNDADTGLTYMQQRYYDPVAGRFLSIDPVVTNANTSTSFNRYAYTTNNPYKFVDPDGRNAITKFVKQTIKHRGNIIQATYDVAGDVVTVFAPSSTPLDRIEAAISLVSPIDINDVRYMKKLYDSASHIVSGRKGGAATRALNEVIGDSITSKDGTVTAGFGRKEAHFPSSGQGNSGGRFSDGSAIDAERRAFQVQTVDVKANGDMTTREINAARDIAERSEQPVVCVAKRDCG